MKREIHTISEQMGTPLEYYKETQRLNRLFQLELQREFANQEGILGSSVALIVPGSDGRLEKGSDESPLEIITLADQDINIDDYKARLEDVLSRIFTTRAIKIGEIKTPTSLLIDHPKGGLQPARVADSSLLYGTTSVQKSAKIKLGSELISLPAKKAHNIRRLRKDATRTSTTGQNRIMGVDAIHFDLKSGEVYFDPTSFRFSFKIGPLRLVQNSLLIEELKHIRRENDPNFMSILETPIVDRLKQLSDDKMVNLSAYTVNEIMQHYAFFLMLYHYSENQYNKNGQTKCVLDESKVSEVKHRLDSLLDLMKKLQIKKQPK